MANAADVQLSKASSLDRNSPAEQPHGTVVAHALPHAARVPKVKGDGGWRMTITKYVLYSVLLAKLVAKPYALAPPPPPLMYMYKIRKLLFFLSRLFFLWLVRPFFYLFFFSRQSERIQLLVLPTPDSHG